MKNLNLTIVSAHHTHNNHIFKTENQCVEKCGLSAMKLASESSKHNFRVQYSVGSMCLNLECVSVAPWCVLKLQFLQG